MLRLDVIAQPSAVDHDLVALLRAARDADGRPPLSDQLWLDLTRGGRAGVAAVAARDQRGALVAYAQLSPGNDTVVVQLVVDPRHRDDLVAIGAPVLAAAAELARTTPPDTTPPDAAPRPVVWWVADPTPDHERIAAELDWSPGRRLHQMRRTLPTGLPVEITTRPFRPGVDDDEWLSVNNRAFADHGEQGGWDRAALAQRLSEPWFDPDGFLVHERDGRMAGFCWTKLHRDTDPIEGEIYVIAVDPDFHGAGLGAQLTLAGLESIERRGVRHAMLFVDAGNVAAVRLYGRLGFTIARTDVAYTGAPSPTPSAQTADPHHGGPAT